MLQVMVQAEEQARLLIAQMAELGLVLPGSITERRARCGNPRCRCQSDPAAWHGPYFVWTRKLDGKTVSKNLTPQPGVTEFVGTAAADPDRFAWWARDHVLSGRRYRRHTMKVQIPSV